MRSKLSLCLLATLCWTGCETVVRAGSPPPCPEWSDAAIAELKHVAPTHPHLELAVGRQLLHCMAIDEMRDD